MNGLVLEQKMDDDGEQLATKLLVLVFLVLLESVLRFGGVVHQSLLFMACKYCFEG